MPNFKIHQITNYRILICIIISLFLWFQWNNLVLIFIIGFIIGTKWITPDLDIDSKPSNHRIWWLYKKVSIHRGRTHNLVYGFIFPLIYLSFFILIIVGLVVILTSYFMHDKEIITRFIEKFIELFKLYYIHFGSFISGICVANGIHIIQDRLN